MHRGISNGYSDPTSPTNVWAMSDINAGTRVLDVDCEESDPRDAHGRPSLIEFRTSGNERIGQIFIFRAFGKGAARPIDGDNAYSDLDRIFRMATAVQLLAWSVVVLAIGVAVIAAVHH